MVYVLIHNCLIYSEIVGVYKYFVDAERAYEHLKKDTHDDYYIIKEYKLL